MTLVAIYLYGIACLVGGFVFGYLWSESRDG